MHQAANTRMERTKTMQATNMKRNSQAKTSRRRKAKLLSSPVKQERMKSRKTKNRKMTSRRTERSLRAEIPRMTSPKTEGTRSLQALRPRAAKATRPRVSNLRARPRPATMTTRCRILVNANPTAKVPSRSALTPDTRKTLVKDQLRPMMVDHL